MKTWVLDEKLDSANEADMQQIMADAARFDSQRTACDRMTATAAVEAVQPVQSELLSHTNRLGEQVAELTGHLGEWQRYAADQTERADKLRRALDVLAREVTVLEMFGECGNTASRNNVDAALAQARAALAEIRVEK